MLDLVLVFVGFGLFTDLRALPISPHSKDHALQRNNNPFRNDMTKKPDVPKKMNICELNVQIQALTDDDYEELFSEATKNDGPKEKSLQDF